MEPVGEMIRRHCRWPRAIPRRGAAPARAAATRRGSRCRSPDRSDRFNGLFCSFSRLKCEMRRPSRRQDAAVPRSTDAAGQWPLRTSPELRNNRGSSTQHPVRAPGPGHGSAFAPILMICRSGRGPPAAAPRGCARRDARLMDRRTSPLRAGSVRLSAARRWRMINSEGISLHD